MTPIVGNWSDLSISNSSMTFETDAVCGLYDSYGPMMVNQALKKRYRNS